MASAQPMFDVAGSFHGFSHRECGEHRTVGAHRAWCFDCCEWCYPKNPCIRCDYEAMAVHNR